jgi:O-antigen ligase
VTSEDFTTKPLTSAADPMASEADSMALEADPLAAKARQLRKAEVFACIGLAIALHTSLTVSWILLIFGFVVTALRPELSRRIKMLGHAPLTLPLFLFALAISVSALANGGLFDAKQIFPNVRSFLIYFYIYQAFASANDGCEEKTLAVFLCTGALAGLYGTVQQLFNFHPGTYQWLQGTGFLHDPMTFAGLMQLSSFLALGLYLQKSYSRLPGLLKQRHFFAAIVVANFMGLLFCGERSAWVGMVAGTLAIALRSSPRFFYQVGLAGLIVLAVGWVCVPMVKARLEPLSHPQTDLGVSTRLKIWKRASDTFVGHPIFGVGPSHFPRITDIPEALVPGRSTDFNHGHSNYFHILATLGIVGFSPFLCLLIVSLRTALRQSAHGAWSSGVGLGTFGALVSLLVAGLFEYNFGAGQVKLAQWFLLGALHQDKDNKT